MKTYAYGEWDMLLDEDGEWVKLSDAQATIAELERKLQQMTDDRDSWAKQASDRVDDCLQLVKAETERCVEAVEFLLVDRRGKSLSFNMIVDAIRQGESNAK